MEQDALNEALNLYRASVKRAPALMMETVNVDANRGVTSRGNSPYDKFASPETRAKVLEARMQEIQAFAQSRNIPASNLYALAEAAMRTGKIPDLGQFGLAGDDAVATKQFLISNVLNIAGLEWTDYKGDPVEEAKSPEEAEAERAEKEAREKKLHARRRAEHKSGGFFMDDSGVDPRRFMAESWDKETVVDPREEGKYEGRSLESLKKEYDTLKARGPFKEGSENFGKMKELAFAIRAKSGWGKVEESTKSGGYPFKDKEEQYRGHSDAELAHAHRDAVKAKEAMKGHDPHAEGWYADDAATIRNEMNRRKTHLQQSVEIDPLRYMAEGSIKAGTEKHRAREEYRRLNDPLYQPSETDDMASDEALDIHGRHKSPNRYGHGGFGTPPREDQFRAVVAQAGPSPQSAARKSDVREYTKRLAPHFIAQEAGRAAAAERRRKKAERQEDSVRIDPSCYMAEEGGPYRTGGAPESTPLSPARYSSAGEVPVNPQSYEKQALLPKEVMAQLRKVLGDRIDGYPREELFRVARERGLLGSEESLNGGNLQEHDFQEAAKKHGGKFLRYIQGNIGVYKFGSADKAQKFASEYAAKTTATPKVNGDVVFIDEPVMGESSPNADMGIDSWGNDDATVKEDRRSESDKILGIMPGDPRADSWPKLSGEMQRLLNLEDCRLFNPKHGFEMPEEAPQQIEEMTVSGGMGAFLGAGMLGSGLTGRACAMPAYDSSYELPDDPEERIKVIKQMLSKHGLKDPNDSK